jgi:hypothetical protein
LSGMAPPSQQDMLKRALQENWTSEKVVAEFDAYLKRRLTH